MSEALKVPNALQNVNEAYGKMMMAYDHWYHRSEHEFEGDLWQEYVNRKNNYCELCTVIVERLVRENPKVLEDMHVLYLS